MRIRIRQELKHVYKTDVCGRMRIRIRRIQPHSTQTHAAPHARRHARHVPELKHVHKTELKHVY
jgi:hypothetical protein